MLFDNVHFGVLQHLVFREFLDVGSGCVGRSQWGQRTPTISLAAERSRSAGSGITPMLGGCAVETQVIPR
jgi:hypothetical protein